MLDFDSLKKEYGDFRTPVSVIKVDGKDISKDKIGIAISDIQVELTSGFEAFKREVLESMDLDAFMSRGHMYQTEMRYYCRNLNTIEVPINYIGSKSSIRFKSVTEALRLLFKLKKNEKNVFKNK